MSQLFYYTPSGGDWNKALPIGNGKLGAMIFGEEHEEHFQLNEDSVWFGTKRNRNNADARKNLDKIRELILNGKISEAENEKICEDDVFTNVMQDMQIILDRLLTIKKLADQNNEYMTSSLCDEYMLEYSKKIWMIKQMKQ